MARRLKVFRTPIGFHDAYVAAPSRKAALAAWGTDADLFARGTAEEVTEARLTAEPLKRPGEVIRVSRGDLAAQLKALGPRKKPAAKTAARSAGTPCSQRSRPNPKHRQRATSSMRRNPRWTRHAGSTVRSAPRSKRSAK